MEQAEYKQGVHQGISNEEYHSNDAVSRSDLCSIRTVPAGALMPDEKTAPLMFGGAAHLYMLENHLFDEMVIESTAKTATAKNFVGLMEDHPDKYIVPAGSIELIQQCAEAIWKHPKAAELLQDFIPEPTIYWKDEDTGIWCKTRPDGMTPAKRRFFDLKFVQPGKADPKKFWWTCRDYGYDLQAAINILGTKKATGIIYPEFWFIVVEKVDPFRVGVYQIDEDIIGDAMFESKQLLELWAQCKKTGVWPNFKADNVDGETIGFY